MKLPRALVMPGIIPAVCGGLLLADWVVRNLTIPRLVSLYPAIEPCTGGGLLVAGVGLLLVQKQRRWARIAAAVMAVLLTLPAIGSKAASLGIWTWGARRFFGVEDIPYRLEGLTLRLADVTTLFVAGTVLAVLTRARQTRSTKMVALALAIVVGLVAQGTPLAFTMDAQPAAAQLLRPTIKWLLFSLLSFDLYRVTAGGSLEAESTNALGRVSFLEKKLALMFGATLTIVILLGLLSCALMGRLVEESADSVLALKFDASLQYVQVQFQSARWNFGYFVDSGNPKYLELGENSLRELEESLSMAKRSSPTTKLDLEIRALSSEIDAEIGIYRRAATLRRELRPAEAIRIISNDAQEKANALSARIASAATAVGNDFAARLARRSAHAGRVQTYFAAVALIAGACLFILHIYFQRDFAALRGAEATIARHNETLRSFAHTVAHDLRAPLRGINGYAHELGHHALATDERAQECVAQITSGSQTLEQLIEDTLLYASLDAEELELGPIDLPGMIADLLEQRAPQIKAYGTEVALNLRASRIVSWKRGVAQVLGNILDNALKYSRNSRPPRIRVESAETTLVWRVIVYDNGIGFDMRYHDRMFGLFRRLVVPDQFEGTGAGLAIAKKILDRLGGTVRAEARPGAGATFLVELPKYTAAELSWPARLQSTSAS